MSPREVIAMALSNRATCHEDDWDWFDMADAVIDALEGMEPTEAMERAGTKPSPRFQSRSETAKSIWRAMVGAMRESK